MKRVLLALVMLLSTTTIFANEPKETVSKKPDQAKVIPPDVRRVTTCGHPSRWFAEQYVRLTTFVNPDEEITEVITTWEGGTTYCATVVITCTTQPTIP